MVMARWLLPVAGIALACGDANHEDLFGQSGGGTGGLRAPHRDAGLSLRDARGSAPDGAPPDRVVANADSGAGGGATGGASGAATDAAVPDTSAPDASSGGVGGAGGSLATGGTGGALDCSTGQKRCGGLCVRPAPGVGCGLQNCVPCAAPPDHGRSICVADRCHFECSDGYQKNDLAWRCDPSASGGTGNASGGAGGASAGGAGGSDVGSGGAFDAGCEDECDGPAVFCGANPNTLMLCCGPDNGCGACYEWVEIACPSGKTCKSGLCG